MNYVFELLPSPDPILPVVTMPDDELHTEPIVVEYMPEEVTPASPLQITFVRHVYAVLTPEDPFMPCLSTVFLVGMLIAMCLSFRPRREVEPVVIQAEAVVPVAEAADVKMEGSKV